MLRHPSQTVFFLAAPLGWKFVHQVAPLFLVAKSAAARRHHKIDHQMADARKSYRILKGFVHWCHKVKRRRKKEKQLWVFPQCRINNSLVPEPAYERLHLPAVTGRPHQRQHPPPFLPFPPPTKLLLPFFIAASSKRTSLIPQPL